MLSYKGRKVVAKGEEICFFLKLLDYASNVADHALQTTRARPRAVQYVQEILYLIQPIIVKDAASVATLHHIGLQPVRTPCHPSPPRAVPAAGGGVSRQVRGGAGPTDGGSGSLPGHAAGPPSGGGGRCSQPDHALCRPSARLAGARRRLLAA